MKSQVALSRNELVIICTALSDQHNSYPDEEDIAKLYDKFGDLLELAPGDDS